MNPRGYTWQKYLWVGWWRLGLVIGVTVVLWRGTPHEQGVAALVAAAVGLTNIAWTQIGRPLWQGFRQGWRSK
jgi:hypothetical protein